MVAHDAQHVRRVGLVAGEGPELLGHLRRGGVGDAGHDGRDGAADGAALGAVVGDALTPSAAADVGEAQAQRAVAVGQLGDLARRELRHQHRDLEHDGPQPAGVLEGVDVERACLRVAERIRFSERGCRPCRRGTCTPSTGSTRGSAPPAGRCASR